jgi:hypothetical protein
MSGALARVARLTQLDGDLLASIALLALAIAFVVVNLAADGNWAKLRRVSGAFLTYATVLVLLARGAGPAKPRYVAFGAAGACAGLVNSLLRHDANPAVAAVSVAGAALLIGGVHWLAVTRWRAVRARLTP